MMERSIFSAKYIFVENLFRRYCYLWFEKLQRSHADGLCCITVQVLSVHLLPLGAGMFFLRMKPFTLGNNKVGVGNMDKILYHGLLILYHNIDIRISICYISSNLSRETD